MKTSYRSYLSISLVVALMLALNSCITIKRFNPLYKANALEHIEIVSKLDANYGYSVEIDLVFIEDNYLAEAIGQLSAMDWFSEKKNGYKTACPGPVCVKHLEIMPGDPVPPLQLPARHKMAKTVLVFAWYLKGDRTHRQDISQMSNAKIILKNSDFTVETMP